MNSTLQCFSLFNKLGNKNNNNKQWKIIGEITAHIKAVKLTTMKIKENLIKQHRLCTTNLVASSIGVKEWQNCQRQNFARICSSCLLLIESFSCSSMVFISENQKFDLKTFIVYIIIFVSPA